MSKNRKVVVFIAQTLDGYIATKDDSLEWLFKVEGEGDNGYSEFYETVDTIVMGKRTFDWIMEQEKGNFPYPNKECFVFTRSQLENTSHVTFLNEDIPAFIHSLKQKVGRDIWIVGGGDLLQTFFKEKLVDEMIVTIAPTILGEGIPLFKEGNYQLDLHLKSVRTFNQFAELHYDVKKA
ncbi:hypothetical protein AM500_13265 [Bacillus sp. FJAT-18017]|uniref:dihydrofolate reductase family protein n=1 Tax=Bacillus sp. FJAT-18017 TaxID=1705566 RepID=UPI0006B05EDB|nr:dihydrofolate reductase family protein [Bacillus sp. FJAT-18017]ALC90647.1 hypothetical protein AM500_13265 [Bacillus sp. FJAT-18017]